MITVINVPTESPKDFYASRRRCLTAPCPSTNPDRAESNSIQDNNNNNNNNNTKTPKITLQRPLSYSIFWRRKKSHKTKYLSDGRKVSDGKVLFPASASKLWKQLFVRTMIHKIEDEIHDPVEQISKLDETLPKLSKDKSASTYSLVSQNRLESQCDKCAPNNVITKWRQIAKSSTNIYDDSCSSPTCSPTTPPMKQNLLSPNDAKSSTNIYDDSCSSPSCSPLTPPMTQNFLSPNDAKY